MSEEDVKDIYFARLIIEREAFVHLQHSPDESVFSSLQQCIHNMDSLTNNENWNVVVKGDVEFHQSVVQALGSKRVNDFYSTIIAQITLCIAHLRGAYMAPSEIATEHKLLLELLRQGDKKPLLKELDRHMESAVEYLTGQH
jgi:DNA-binding GntR family transcriptional regulator